MTLNVDKPAHALMVFDRDLNMFFVYDTLSNPDRWLAVNPWITQGNANSDITTATNGNVGIGTTGAPTAKLEVNGNIKANGNVISTGNLTTTGNVTASNVSASNVTTTGSVTSATISTGNVNSSGTVTATKFVGEGVIPAGGIILWSGSVPPSGWALCDGTNGTPDLRGRFIVGTGSFSEGAVTYTYPLGATGGEVKHELSVAEMPRHNHKIPIEVINHNHGATVSIPQMQPGGPINSHYTGGDGTQSEGPGIAHENRPPYYALAYIMKLQ